MFEWWHWIVLGLCLSIAELAIPAFFIKKGAWLQHRAHTLALWMMFTMAVPMFVTDSMFAVNSSRSATALFAVSALALAANVAVLVFQIYTIAKRRLNPLTDQLYTWLPQYKAVVAANISPDAQDSDVHEEVVELKKLV